MKDIFFDPAIGIKYGQPDSIFNKKIMVLGSSHYCGLCPQCGQRQLSDGTCLQFTKNTVDYYLYRLPSDKKIDKREGWRATYSTFVNSLIGRTSSLEDRKQVFDSIVFYNYLQESAGEDAYSANQYDFKEEKHLKAFYEALHLCKPDAVICWGNTVWDALPNNWGYGVAMKGEPIIFQDKEFTRHQVYPFNNAQILLIGVHHPSQGYGRDFHYQIFSQLLGC